MSGKWIGLVAGWLMLNGFALFASSHAYNAWTIRTRNRMYYFVLRREVNRERAARADEIAKDVVRWLRPLFFVAANVVWLLLAWQTFANPGPTP